MRGISVFPYVRKALLLLTQHCFITSQALGRNEVIQVMIFLTIMRLKWSKRRNLMLRLRVFG